MIYVYVPQTLLRKYEQLTLRYETAKRFIKEETQPEQIKFAAQQANEIYLQLKKTQQLINNYKGKFIHAT